MYKFQRTRKCNEFSQAYYYLLGQCWTPPPAPPPVMHSWEDYLDDNGLPTILLKEKVISCSLVTEDKAHLCTLPVPNKSRKFGVEGGTYPQYHGCRAGVCAPPPPSPIPLLLPLQIPCSLVVTKLIGNSCAPSPNQTQEKLKREPQSLGCCRAEPLLLGWG